MNELGIGIGWCALQIAAVAIVAGGVCFLRRRDPRVHVTVALTAFIVIAALTATVFLPGPQWPAVGGWFDPPADSDTMSTGAMGVETAATDTTPDRSVAETTESDTSTTATTSADADGPSFATLFAAAVRDELRKTTVPPVDNEPQWRWPAWFALFVLCGLGIGAVRLTAGLLVVARYRRPGVSRAIDDAPLLELLDVIRAELNCRTAIDVRESAAVPSAATFGWRRPVILLPNDWRNWSTEERRAVLAHEVAHVSRRDFLLWVAAQSAVVLHFYHPLVHWLAGRLRLAQELASDSLAAQVAGGRDAYLQTLAGMALRQPEHNHAWPARAFLPTRRTFLRRIEMLKDRRARTDASSRIVRWLPAALLVMSGVLLAGLRPPSSANDKSNSPPFNQPLPGRSADSTSGFNPFANNGARVTDLPVFGGEEGTTVRSAATAIELKYVPADAVGVVALRPAALLNSQLSKHVKLPETLRKEKLGESQIGIPFIRIEQITFILLPPAGPPAAPGAVMPAFGGTVIRATEAGEGIFAALVKNTVPDAVKTEAFGLTYYKSSRPNNLMCYALPDERTIIIDRETNLQRMLLGGANSPTKFSKSATWKRAAGGHAAAAFDMTWVRDNMKFAGPGGGQGPLLNPTLLAPFSPLWEDSELMFLSAGLDGKELEVVLTIESAGEKQSARVKETMLAAITLGKNAAREYRKQITQSRTPEVPLLLTLMNTVDELLDEHSLIQEGATVQLGLAADVNLALVAPLVSVMRGARTAAQQAQARNNLKQIGLALHNYYDTYERFPPAVVYPIGNDGKPKKIGHSWRVALLPFLEGAALYEQYNFDEPWDSEQNKKVLAQMPAVFRDPQADSKSTNAAYFAVVGKDPAVAGREVEFGTGLPGAGASAAGESDAEAAGGGAGGAAPGDSGLAPGFEPPGGLPGAAVQIPFYARTLFAGKEGARMFEITDGTSNTIAIVEAKRDTPWTKPEDIAYDGKKVPKFGGWYNGGFHAALCDGSVQFFPDSLAEQDLKYFLLINDGYQVPKLPDVTRR